MGLLIIFCSSVFKWDFFIDYGRLRKYRETSNCLKTKNQKQKSSFQTIMKPIFLKKHAKNVLNEVFCLNLKN